MLIYWIVKSGASKIVYLKLFCFFTPSSFSRLGAPSSIRGIVILILAKRSYRDFSELNGKDMHYARGLGLPSHGTVS